MARIYVPQKDNSERRSITELEYRKALDERKLCLIFLLSEEAPWPKIKQDKGIAAEQIETFRQTLLSCERHIVNFFENADELTRKVNESVIKWEKDSGLAGKRQLTDWDAYRKAVCNKHQWVRLQVIAGASKDLGITKIPLIEVFQPQLAAQGASRMDMPDEVLDWPKYLGCHNDR